MYDDLKNEKQYETEQYYEGDSYYKNQSHFEQYLLPNEHILWEGEYNKGGAKLSPMQMYTFIFSIFWLSFSILWTVLASFGGGLFGMFGIPFILIGVFLMKSNFSVKKCSYAITNMRVMSFDGKKLYADMLDNVIDISLSEGRNNIGNVIFSISGNVNYYNNRNNMLNMQNGLNGFYGVKNPQNVFNILNTAVYDYIQNNK